MAKTITRVGDIVIRSTQIDAVSMFMTTHYAVVDTVGRTISEGTFVTKISTLPGAVKTALQTLQTALLVLADAEHEAREAAYAAG